jgi:hypothetical protein
MLDLQQLVPIDRGHVFLRLDDDVEDGLRIFPEVRDRLLNALYFCGRIEAIAKTVFAVGICEPLLRNWCLSKMPFVASNVETSSRDPIQHS